MYIYMNLASSCVSLFLELFLFSSPLISPFFLRGANLAELDQNYRTQPRWVIAPKLGLVGWC